MKNEKIEIQKLADLYLNNLLSHREMAKETGGSVSLIVKLLKESGLFVPIPSLENPKKGDIKKAHEVLKKRKWNNGNYTTTKAETFFEKDKKYIVTCKKTNKTFKDFENKSGVLTSHLQEIYPDFEKPTNYFLRQEKLSTGKPWYNEYFDFEVDDSPKPETVSCLDCGWETTDVNNDGGWLTQHIKQKHGLILDYIGRHPEQKDLFQTILMRETYKLRHEKSTKSHYVSCKICGEKLSSINNSHLKKHKLTVTDYKIAFPDANVVSSKTSQKLSKISSNYNLNKTSYKTSSIEKRFFSSIECLSGIKRQQPIGGYVFDCVDHQEKIAIEIDGEYWHGHDRTANFTFKQVFNVVRDVRKSESAKKEGYTLYRIRGGVVNSILPEKFTSKKELFSFLSNNNFLIENHPLLNLKEYDVIFGKEYCERNHGAWEKNSQKLEDAIFELWTKFYHPQKYIDTCIDLSKRRTNSIWLKGVMKKAYYKSHKNGSPGLFELFRKENILRPTIKYRLGLNKSNEFFDVSLRQLYKGIEVRTMYNVGVFPIKTAKELYNLHKVDGKRVYDPYSGWGSRMLACVEQGGYYIGNDINIDLAEGYRYIIDEKELYDKVEVEFGDSKKKKMKLKESIDFIMTSPPFYYDEIYSKSNQEKLSVEEWFEQEIYPVFKNCFYYLKPDSHIVIDMNDRYKNETIKQLERSGFIVKSSEVYNVAKSHYDKVNKNSKQQILITAVKPLSK